MIRTRRRPSAPMPLQDAIDHVSVAATPLDAETIDLRRAVGRITAESVLAESDLVPFDRSAMDGYAVRALDVAGASRTPILLPLRARVYARSCEPVHAPKTATAIATGAPIPRGADAVIPLEQSRRRGAFVEFRADASCGQHVFQRGDDARAGDELVCAGECLKPATLGLLSAAGRTSLRVVRRPRVAIVCTGDELVDVHVTPRPGEIRNSNGPMLASLVLESGGDVRLQRTVPDDPSALRRSLDQALSQSDLVITNGGASVGARDFVKSTLEALGVTFAFRSVAIRPARPTAFGRREATLVGVLPGNPAAAFVGFMELIRPAIARLGGRCCVAMPRVTAQLRERVHAKAERHYILFGRVSYDGSTFAVTPLPNQCSSLVRTAKDANGLIVLPPRASAYEATEIVDVHMLDWANVLHDA